MARGRSGQRLKWPEVEVARGRGGQGTKWPEDEVARGRSGQRTKWPGDEVARGRSGQGTKWPEFKVARVRSGQRCCDWLRERAALVLPQPISSRARRCRHWTLPPQQGRIQATYLGRSRQRRDVSHPSRPIVSCSWNRLRTNGLGSLPLVWRVCRCGGDNRPPRDGGD